METIAKPMGKKELATMYGVARYQTWMNMLKPVQEKLKKGSKYYYPYEVKLIREFLDHGIVPK